MRLTGNWRDLGIYDGGSKQAVAIQIQEDTLKQMLEIEDATKSPFEYFDFVIEPFDETAVLALDTDTDWDDNANKLDDQRRTSV